MVKYLLVLIALNGTIATDPVLYADKAQCESVGEYWRTMAKSLVTEPRYICIVRPDR